MAVSPPTPSIHSFSGISSRASISSQTLSLYTDILQSIENYFSIHHNRDIRLS